MYPYTHEADFTCGYETQYKMKVIIGPGISVLQHYRQMGQGIRECTK